MTISADSVKNFTVIGSGTLGARIGLQAALSGYNVKLYDVSEEAFERAFKEYGRIRHLLIKNKRIEPEEFDNRLATINTSIDLKEACRTADLISESVIENINLKKKVWSEIGPACPEHTILTTNTSFLLPSMFASETQAPERFAAFHFHDVFTARVVDIMPHHGTDPSIINTLKIIGHKLNQIPVVIRKETPGYIFNKLFSNILMTSGEMLADGIAGIEDIDKSWMGNYHTPSGPFGMMDEVGIDTVYHVAKAMVSGGSDEFMKLLEKMMKEGKLGIKSGQGFYTYPLPAYKSKDFLA